LIYKSRNRSGRTAARLLPSAPRRRSATGWRRRYRSTRNNEVPGKIEPPDHLRYGIK
jgi:hypothetical protein